MLRFPRTISPLLWCWLLASPGACGSDDTPLPAPDAGPPPPPASPPEIVRFLPSVALVVQSSTVSLSWEVQDADTVVLSSDALGWRVADLPSEGSAFSPPLEANTRFSLFAEGPGGTTVESVEVAVQIIPEPARIDRFEAFPERFDGPGTEVSLTWRATGALTLLANDVPVPEFPAEEALFWQTFVSGPTRFVLLAVSADGSSDRREVFVRRSGQELEPNDERNNAGFLDVNGSAVGTITAQDVDWYTFEVSAGASVGATVTNGSLGCDFDSQLELWGPDPDRPGQIRFLALADDDPLGRVCAILDPRLEPAATELPAGRYYLTVRGFDAGQAGPYQLDVSVSEPGCGNGIVEVTRNETCDDGGLLDGDGCSSICTAEVVATWSGPDLDETTGIRPGPTVQTFALAELTRDGALYAEARDSNGACPNGLRIELLDTARSSGGGLAVIDDGFRWPCGTLSGRPLSAGRYLLRVLAPVETDATLRVRLADRGCGDFILDEGESCDDGNRSSGDGCSATCEIGPVGTATAGAGSVAVVLPDQGPRLVTADVTQLGASLTASVSGPTADIALSLYNAGFQRLGEAAPGAPLALGQTTFADDLAPGRYYVGLRRVEPGSEAARVEIKEVGPSCPDGALQRMVGEQCDDGGSSPEDGCSPSCRFEINGSNILVPGVTADRLAAVPGPGDLYFSVISSTVTALNFRVGHPTVNVCDTVATTDLTATVLTSELEPYVFDDGGPMGCPNVGGLRLDTGQWYLRVSAPSGFGLDPVDVLVSSVAGRCGDFGLDANEACDDGNPTIGDGCNTRCQLDGGGRFLLETEVNDSRRQALDLGIEVGRGSVEVAGAIRLGDVDYYAFDVGRWQETLLEATTSEASSLCRIDTRLRVLDAQGQLLADNDDDPARPGAGCSRVLLNGPNRLFEGRYYLEVSAGSGARDVPVYVLEVELR